MEDPRNITFCTHLLYCSKNIERIGDHATNIAETVFYLVTGSTLPAERPRVGTNMKRRRRRARRHERCAQRPCFSLSSTMTCAEQ